MKEMSVFRFSKSSMLLLVLIVGIWKAEAKNRIGKPKAALYEGDGP